MANFNPGLNPTSDPEYDRVRGINLENVEGRNKEVASRRTAESLFAGLNAGVKGLDNTIQQTAKNELESGYERLNGAQGVDLAAANAVINPENTVSNPTGGSAIPTNEQKFLAEGMERLTAARDQGKVSNTHYYAQLEAMVRNVKSRYPGYSEVIDRQIEGIAGVKPANALRQSMLHDLERDAAAKTEKLSQKDKFILDHGQFATQADREDYRSGKIDTDTMIARIQDRKGAVQDLEAERSRVAAATARGELDEKNAEKAAGGIAGKNMNLAMDDISSLYKEAEKQKEAGTYDPALFGMVLQKHRLTFMEKATKDIHEAFDGKMDVAKVNQIVERVASRYDDYAQAFTKEGSGLLNIYKAEIEATKDKDLAQILSSDIGVPMRALMQAGRLSPDLAKEMFLQMNSVAAEKGVPGISSRMEGVLGGNSGTKPSGGDAAAKKDAGVQTLVFQNKVAMATGTSNWGDPKKLVENLVKVGKDQPTNVEMVLNSWTDNLTNPKYPADFVKNSARALFSEGNKDFLTYAFKDFESQKRAFALLTSPKVTSSMEKLKGQKEYKDYQDWAYNGYITILKQSVNAFKNVAERPYLNLKFDRSTAHFSLEPNAEGERVAKEKWYNQSIPANLATQLEKVLGGGLSDTVRSINEATDNVAKIMKEDGYKVDEQVENLVAALDKANINHKHGVWPWIVQSLQLPDKDPDDLTFGGTHPNFTQASGSNGEPRGLTSLIKYHGPATASQAIMDMIAKGESGSNYNRLVDTPTHPREAPLTDMSVREVLAYQKGMIKAGNKSSAAGKYQIVGQTLRNLVDKGVVKLEDRYDEGTQDRLANALLEGRGYKDYMEGKKSLRAFLDDLGNEWEILKVNPSLARKVAEELKNQKLAYAE